MNDLRLCTLTLLVLISGCSSSSSVRRDSVHQTLLVKPGEAGEEITYDLHSHRGGVPRISRSVERSYEVASLGLNARDINKSLGESLGLKPWRGVMVDRVNRRSAAERAGISHSDVLLSYDGVELSTTVQLKELIQESSTPGVTVPITLLRKDAKGGYELDALQFHVTLDGVDATETKSETILLAADPGVYLMTGLQVGSLPEELATEMYDNAEPVVLIADALVGSPAYHAGFRTGDKVLTCDGQAVQSHQDISRAVLARSTKLKVPMEEFSADSRKDVPQASGPIQLVVEGPLGRHEAQLLVRDDLFDNSEFNIPIVFDCNGNIQRSRWSFLDFIFQFGANYRSSYRRSSSRGAEEDTFFSLFPLGMFEFESNAHYDKYCFLWFIEFKDRH